MLTILSTGALEIAQSSPFPISNGGDGVMFAVSLFAVVSISFLMLMRAIATVRQMWMDRNREDRREVFWLRATILIIAVAIIIYAAPEAVYKVAWKEVEPDTLHTILAVKEWSRPIAFLAMVGWLGIYSYHEPQWTLKLSHPLNRVWGGNRGQVNRFVLVVFLSGLLAGAIALSKAFS